MQKNSRICACGCGKLFVGKGDFALAWHDPGILKKVRDRAWKFIVKRTCQREDQEDFVGWAVEEFIRRGYTNQDHLWVDYLRKKNGDYRTLTAAKKAIAQAIPIEDLVEVIPDQTGNPKEFAHSESKENALRPLSKWSQAMVEAWLLGVASDRIRLLFQTDYKHVKWAIRRFQVEYIKLTAQQSVQTAEKLQPLQIEWIKI